jgi:UDP-N-acetylglucosamine--N-acetylmuramyl-(pentapeptide) pyrophosphoryl-undecaprenol N-acetylglucosamine transferase
MNSPTVIFTGGHHTSALEVAKHLKDRGWQIIWFGHKYSMWGDTSPSAEYREVTAAGIKFIQLTAGKLHRTYNPLKLIRIPFGFLQSFWYLLRIRITSGKNLKGIVTFGGYLGVPVVFTGWLLGLPVIAHEQTTTAGWANKFISFFARKIAIAWSSAAQIYPLKKTVFVGLPLRQEILSVLNNPVAQKKLLFVTGGKQGSHIINIQVFAVLEKLLEKFTVVHQTGSSTVFRDYDQAVKLKSELPEKLQKKYLVHEYLSSAETARTLSAAEVVISRSGAHIMYELGLLGSRCVLIPIPWSSHNEQFKNAGVLENNSQAVILTQDDLTPESLLAAVEKAQKLQPSPLHLPKDATDKTVQLIESEFLK